MSYWIVTDACCDLTTEYIRTQRDFTVVPMSYQIDGQVYELDPAKDGVAESCQSFYAMLRKGKVATTFQINQQGWVEALSPILEQGCNILVIVFSSGLSGTCNAALAAQKELKDKYPERVVCVVDGLSASAGQGLLTRYALQNRDAGMSLEENAAWTKENATNTVHWFTVDDLQFLRRGGRVSTTSAYLGSMLKIKPVLNVDTEGKLIPKEKVQGRKRSLRTLLEKARENALEPEKQTMLISHGDSEEDAHWLGDKLKAELKVPQVEYSYIGPIVGSHAGPGTVALFFMGKGR